MILPLFTFLLIGEPDMSVTKSPPLVFSVVDPASNSTLVELEICTETVKHVAIDFSDFERRPVVNFALTEAASQELTEITTRYVGFLAPLLIDGKVISSPIINGPITDGMFSITGVDTIAEAEKILQAARGRCSFLKAEDE